MEVYVDGEELPPQEQQVDGWIVTKTTKKAEQEPATTPEDRKRQALRGSTQLRRRAIKAARMPHTSRDHYRIISRPRGGLDVSKTASGKIQSAFLHAAKLPPNDEDVVYPNAAQNIVVISTPSEERASAYAQVRSFTIGQTEYETHSYRAATDNTCKGVIRGFLPEDTIEEVEQLVIHNKRNPKVLAMRRLGGSGAFVVLFEGLKVPNWVYAGSSPIKCTLYKKQLDICHACGRIGHRTDVCPKPEDVLCRGCGVRNPPAGHQCTPVCRLCGGDHPLGDYRCKKKFQVPYVVRRRRWEQRTQDNPPTTEDPKQWPALTEERGRSRSRSNSRSRSRSRSQTPSRKEVTWADRAAQKVRRGINPEQTAIEKMQKQMHEMARQFNQKYEKLEKENAELRRLLYKPSNTPPPSSPPLPAREPELRRLLNKPSNTPPTSSPSLPAREPESPEQAENMDESPPTRKRPKNPNEAASLEDRITALEEKVDKRFAAIEARLESVDKVLEAFLHLTARTEATENAIKNMEAAITQITQTLTPEVIAAALQSTKPQPRSFFQNGSAKR